MQVSRNLLDGPAFGEFRGVEERRGVARHGQSGVVTRPERHPGEPAILETRRFSNKEDSLKRGGSFLRERTAWSVSSTPAETRASRSIHKSTSEASQVKTILSQTWTEFEESTRESRATREMPGDCASLVSKSLAGVEKWKVGDASPGENAGSPDGEKGAA